MILLSKAWQAQWCWELLLNKCTDFFYKMLSLLLGRHFLLLGFLSWWLSWWLSSWWLVKVGRYFYHIFFQANIKLFPWLFHLIHTQNCRSFVPSTISIFHILMWAIIASLLHNMHLYRVYWSRILSSSYILWTLDHT